MNAPIITIITVCWNAETDIAKTIESVIGQDFENIEYLIIDGKSTDSTTDIINGYIKNNPSKSIRLISEKDSGIYNAMNKGIIKSNGEWLLFLNAGDTLYSDSSINDLLSYAVPGCSFVYGDANYVDGDNSYVVKHKSIETIKRSMPFCHQAIACKRATLLKYNYDEKYKVCADYDMFLKAYINGERFVEGSLIVCNYLIGGFSKKNEAHLLKEYAEIKYTNGVIKNKQLYYLKSKANHFVRSLIKAVIPERARTQIRKRLYTGVN